METPDRKYSFGRTLTPALPRRGGKQRGDFRPVPAVAVISKPNVALFGPTA
jgi:hypothetical protein